MALFDNSNQTQDFVKKQIDAIKEIFNYSSVTDKDAKARIEKVATDLFNVIFESIKRAESNKDGGALL